MSCTCCVCIRVSEDGCCDRVDVMKQKRAINRQYTCLARHDADESRRVNAPMLYHEEEKPVTPKTYPGGRKRCENEKHTE